MSDMSERCSCMTHSTGITCGTCRFGLCPGCTYPNEILCHRHAPLTDEGWKWPRVHRSWWCGDYEPTEAAR
jgi:hypothetical protein